MLNAAKREGKSDWKAIDLPLLLFIIGVANVKLYVKLAAAALYFFYCLYKRWLVRKPIPGVTTFYLLMPAAGIAGALFHGAFNNANYAYVFLFGTGIWLLAGGVSWLIYLSATQLSKESLTATLKLFFALNFLVSLGQLVYVMIDSEHLMPYWFSVVGGKYGISTGDYIRGITGNTSVVNGALASLGILFFYFRKQWPWLALCLLTMVLCTTNLTLLCVVFVVLIIVILARGYRRSAVVLLVSTIALYWAVSPDNMIYIGQVFEKILFPKQEGPPSPMQLYYKQHREAFFRVNVRDSICNNYGGALARLKLRSATDTTLRHGTLSRNALSEAINDWYGTEADSTPLYFVNGPGKVYALKQTLFYALSEKRNLPAGAGMGNFSSLLATRVSGLGIEGHYPEKYAYASVDYLDFHLYDILYYFSRSESEHSVMNTPDDVYAQLIGEYGVIGVSLFLICYLGYFFRKRKQIGTARYILVLTLLFFGYGYWFEMVNLTVFFELLMFMDIFAGERTDGISAVPDNSINARI